jgi:hypothetical protein
MLKSVERLTDFQYFPPPSQEMTTVKMKELLAARIQ